MSRLKSLFDMLLLLVNGVGIVGALLEAAGIRWSGGLRRGGIPLESVRDNEVLEGAVFWGGLLLFCILAVLLWRGNDKKKIGIRAGVCGALWAVCALFWGKGLYGGLLVALQGSVKNLGTYYQIHISWQDGAALLEEAGFGGAGTMAATLGTLFFLFPVAEAAGFLWKKSRGGYLLAGNVIWFSAACTFDVFPGFLFLSLCVLGLVASLVQKDFEEAPTAGFGAVMAVTVMAGAVMGLSYRFLLPAVDERYEGILEEREEFYRMVNEDWISGIRSVLSGYGIVPGVDVTGAFNRAGVISYTVADAYRVTVDRVPRGALYLKGFVGDAYGGNAWEARTDREMEYYYRQNGLEVPEDYGMLVNISYEAAGALGGNFFADQITLEELGGRGSYCLYPYGALMTEGYRVHGDGSVERGDSKRYGFSYRYLTGNKGCNVLKGQWAELEGQYRRYVYDNFLEYPAEALPRYTECLEQADIGTDSVGGTVVDVMKFLERQAAYNLDAGRNPRGTDFVEYFLFDSHEGYCVHFASAAVLALRYFGIPARYAAGYAVMPSEFAPQEGGGYAAVLTGRQAHAWAEIYLDALGWVPVEMTPGAAAFPEDNRGQQLAGLGFGQAVLREEDEKDEEEMRRPVASSGYEEDEEDEEEEEEPVQEPWNRVQGEDGQPEAAGGGEGFAIPMLLVGAALAAALCALALWLQRAVRRRWQRVLQEAGTGERIFLLYGNLKKAVRIAGSPGWWARSGEESWRELERACPGVGQEEYEAFCAIMEKNSFGNVEPSPEELWAVWALHDRTVGGVYAGAPFYKRMLFGALGCHVCLGGPMEG